MNGKKNLGSEKDNFLFIFDLRFINFLLFLQFILRDICFYGNRCITYKIKFGNRNILIYVSQNKTYMMNTFREFF